MRPRRRPLAAPGRLAALSSAWRGAWWLPWLGFALLLAAAPWLARGSAALGMLAQMGIAIIACLSYNILLGQGGMLSFGHAVYTGLGAYAAIHLLAAAGRHGWPLPVSLLPLAGGLAALAAAALLGWLGTRRGGATFAMISLGLGELVFAAALMLTGLSGGDAGIAADRVLGPPLLGLSFGPVGQVYALVAAYTFACTALMYALTRTPLGRLLNAVRDNPARVAFIGFDPRRVRYLCFCIAGFFAGVAGGLAALLFEIVTAEALGAERSGGYLLFTFLGGATLFYGPIIGGVLMVLASVWLSSLTPAWLLYLGLLFMLVVIWAPQGLAGTLAALPRALAQDGLRDSARRAAARAGKLAGALALLLAGAITLVEMLYHRLHADAGAPPLRLWGLALDVQAPAPWLGAAALAALGLWLTRRARPPRRALWPPQGAAPDNGPDNGPDSSAGNRPGGGPDHSPRQPQSATASAAQTAAPGGAPAAPAAPTAPGHRA